MPITRRKSQIYPVALAITLLIASKAKAQLCPTAVEAKNLSGFAEQASFAAPAEKTSGQIRISPVAMPLHSSQPAIATTANFGSASAQPALAEVSLRNFLPQAVVSRIEPMAVNRRQTDFVHELMLAAAQPMLAEASFQSLFVE
jgi:hypothetical protein